jgi:hypothetical protein
VQQEPLSLPELDQDGGDEIIVVGDAVNND